ncbi:MAG: PAS domain S-box protein [Chloroflexi bacterium]|nr:PAS domain S-box protein [Chloroflexota bacterium]
MMKPITNISLNIFNRMSARLVVVFLLLSILPLAFTGFLSFNSQRHTIEQNTLTHLLSTTILKEAEFNRWIEDKENSLEELAREPAIQAYAGIVVFGEIDAPELLAIRTSIREDHFTPSIEIEIDWLELFLLQASNGQILVSTVVEREGMYQESQPYFVEGQSGSYVQNVYYSMILEAAAMTIGTPVKDEEGNVVAVLAGRVNLAEMSKIMTQGTGLSRTEETYLVNSFNFWVTDSRFEPGYALKKVIHTEGVEECLAHIEGSGLYDDYRGVPVIGVYRWIPEWELCLLTEVDQAEAFAPIETLRREVMGAGIGVSLFVVLMAILFSRSITEPVRQLVRGAEEIGRGNLAYRVETAARDELGLLAGAFNDMSAKRQRAENSLRESEENLSATLNGIGDGVIATDVESCITRLNPIAEELTGWTQAEALGRSLGEVFPIIGEKTRQKVENPVTRVIREGKVVGMGNDTLLTSKDGQEMPIADSAAPIFNTEGGLTGVVLVFRDQTEERRAEQALRDYSERLEDMVGERTQELRDTQEQLIRKERLAVLGELAGGVGHELRNPLTGIANAVYYLQAIKADADETTREYLGIISDEVEIASKIIADLLALGRMQPTEKQQIAVHEIVSQVLEKGRTPENVKVDNKITTKALDVNVDPSQIGQVLNNLLDNAYHAMPEGGVITIDVQVKQERVHMSIADNGTGIPEENLANIFEPLFTTKARGIGLGLALSKRLVEANGGEIEIESEVGKGSTFTIILPSGEAE